jgi:hypothetical protein
VTRSFRVPFTTLLLTPTEAYPKRKSLSYPLLPVLLSRRRYRVRVMGLIDSCSDDCIFPASIGRLLGLTVEAGRKQPFMGAGMSNNLAYFHRVTVGFELDDAHFRFSAYLGFSPALDFPRIGLLGRVGFFDRFRQVNFHAKSQVVELVASVTARK